MLKLKDSIKDKLNSQLYSRLKSQVSNKIFNHLYFQLLEPLYWMPDNRVHRQLKQEIGNNNG